MLAGGKPLQRAAVGYPTPARRSRSSLTRHSCACDFGDATGTAVRCRWPGRLVRLIPSDIRYDGGPARRSPTANAASSPTPSACSWRCWVTAAGISDSAAGLPLLTQVAADQPTITKAWADSAYRTTVIEGAAALGIDLEVVSRDPATRGFTPLPRRRVAERTSAGSCCAAA